MRKKRIAIIINPVAGGGRGRKAWDVLQAGLRALFEDIDFRISNRVGDIGDLSIDLLAAKPDYFLVIGGDGTLSEALNGFYKDDKSRVPKTQFAYFNAGCGGDFARLFPHQYVTEFLNRLIHGTSQQTNIGKIQFADKRVRYFINAASCGFSAYVAKLSENSRWLKKLGGTMNYLFHSLKGMLSYHPQKVSIRLDVQPPINAEMLLLAICNGQYFGGKMHVAPMARVDDNLLDVVMFLDFSKVAAIFKMVKIYSGSHVHEKKVHYCQAKKVEIYADSSAMLVEADGQLLGSLPATFELLPQMLKIIV